MGRLSHVHLKLDLRQEKLLYVLNARGIRITGCRTDFDRDRVAIAELRLEMLDRAETSQLASDHDAQPIADTLARSRTSCCRVSELVSNSPFVHGMTSQNDGQFRFDCIEKDLLHLLASVGIDACRWLVENGDAWRSWNRTETKQVEGRRKSEMTDR